jgi:hypothetical protein
VKVLVFIDHDIICRHFILSGALRLVEENAEVVYVFPENGSKRFNLDPATLKLRGRYCRVGVPDKRIQAWRWLLFADQLRWRPGRFERALRRFRRAHLGWRAALLLTLGSYPPFSFFLRHMVARQLAAHPVNQLVDLLESETPDVVLHPSVLDGTFINDVNNICQIFSIPCIVAMNSWDNPSTKRSVVALPSWLLVWGEQTKEHALRFVGIPHERVVPFGVAQFEVFDNAPRKSRSEFAQHLGIAPDKLIFLFAGSNARTDELDVLLALDEAIEVGHLPGIAVVYRPHPWGGGGQQHVVIDPTMQSYIKALAAGDPGITLPDYRDTHDILSLVDAVISPMSTILIEAALHSKPVIIHAPESEDPLAPLGSAIPMLHFEQFLALPDVRLTRNKVALELEIKSLLSHSEAQRRGQGLYAECSKFITKFERPWSERIVEFIKFVAYGNKLGDV